MKKATNRDYTEILKGEGWHKSNIRIDDVKFKWKILQITKECILTTGFHNNVTQQLKVKRGYLILISSGIGYWWDICPKVKRDKNLYREYKKDITVSERETFNKKLSSVIYTKPENSYWY